MSKNKMENDIISKKEQQLASFLPGNSFCQYVKKIDTTLYSSSTYHVNYKLLKSDKKELTRKSAYCFGGLPALVYQYRDRARYICYTVELANCITKQDAFEWAKLGRKIGLLPSEQTPQEMISRPGITIDLEKTTLTKLYMQLCWIRWLHEGAGIVKHSLKLVNAFGCDPWAAVAYTHLKHVKYLDQSLLPYGYYRVGNTPLDASRDAGYIVKLHWLMNNSALSDSNESYKAIVLRKKGVVKWDWNLKRIIPKKRIVLQRREMLLSPLIFPITSCSGFENIEGAAAQLGNEKGIKIEKITCCS